MYFIEVTAFQKCGQGPVPPSQFLQAIEVQGASALSPQRLCALMYSSAAPLLEAQVWAATPSDKVRVPEVMPCPACVDRSYAHTFLFLPPVV